MLKNKCQSFSRLTLWLTRQSWNFSRLTLQLASHETPVTSSSRSFRDSPSRETPRNSFLKSFSWENCFKPLTSSSKLLFQYFFIKTQSIWMVFHSINISKIIINSFHWFWSLDYVLESFVLLVGIFIIRVGKTWFLSNFFMGLVSFVDLH